MPTTHPSRRALTPNFRGRGRSTGFRDNLTDNRRADKGRGSSFNPANRFERLRLDVIEDNIPLPSGEGAESRRDKAGEGGSDLPVATETLSDDRGNKIQTQVFADQSRSALNRVDSPDIGFNWTVNPYRGCEHGCIYCYARPTHEYLGLSSGLDFETKIFAKLDAPKLLREELSRPTWKPQTVVMSGVTDPYQPIESKLHITRGCLEVFADARQPVAVVTKSRLILRDLDLLQELARFNAVRVAVSVTTLDNQLAAKMEPRAASPRDRLWTIQRLASAGIPVIAMVAPVIPAVTDREIPNILRAVADAGVSGAAYTLLRLPWQNKQLFIDWLDRHFPQRAEHVLSLLCESRDGQFYKADFGRMRMQGRGPYADQLEKTFDLFVRRHGLDRDLGSMNANNFRRPMTTAQLPLFAA